MKFISPGVADPYNKAISSRDLKIPKEVEVMCILNKKHNPFDNVSSSHIRINGYESVEKLKNIPELSKLLNDNKIPAFVSWNMLEFQQQDGSISAYDIPTPCAIYGPNNFYHDAKNLNKLMKGIGKIDLDKISNYRIDSHDRPVGNIHVFHVAPSLVGTNVQYGVHEDSIRHDGIIAAGKMPRKEYFTYSDNQKGLIDSSHIEDYKNNPYYHDLSTMAIETAKLLNLDICRVDIVESSESWVHSVELNHVFDGKNTLGVEYGCLGRGYTNALREIINKKL